MSNMYGAVSTQKYATANKIKPARRLTGKRETRMSLKQRLRNWLFDEEQQPDAGYIEMDRLQSEGIRLQIYKASGGYVVETRGYDRKNDRNTSTMHVITEDQDLGDALGKIVMMEALRG